MAKEKWLYEFSVNKEITETTSEKTKNDKYRKTNYGL